MKILKHAIMDFYLVILLLFNQSAIILNIIRVSCNSNYAIFTDPSYSVTNNFVLSSYNSVLMARCLKPRADLQHLALACALTASVGSGICSQTTSGLSLLEYIMQN